MYVCMSFQVRYFEDYANEFNLNIQYDTDIKKIARDRVTKDFVLHDQNDQVYTCPVLIMGCVYCVYSCTCSCRVSEETTSRKFLITLLIELASNAYMLCQDWCARYAMLLMLFISCTCTCLCFLVLVYGFPTFLILVEQSWLKYVKPSSSLVTCVHIIHVHVCDV